MSDQTVPVRTGEALTHQARHDSLTGLPNRLAFAESLQSLRGCRASVLLLDLDRFKDVNDILGHDQGDRLLEVVGKRLRSGCGGHEVFRLGGDEFAVVVPEAGQVEAVELASLVRSRLSEVVRVGDLSISVRCSVGVAVDAGGVTPGELLRHADVAMYAAKRTASGVVAFDPALDEGSMDRLELSGRIPAGLLNGEFVVFYQPIVHLDSGRIVGMEALVRWDHPERGLLPPAQFLDLVKVGGYLPRLTRWVLGEALTEVRICREWCPELRVSVNLSALNLFQPELVRETLSMLQDAEVAEGALIFELTEDDLIDDPDTALAVVEELAAAGIGVSIDDFGTGFSSLAYLNRLPIDEIKIDRTFIAGLPDAGTHETLSRSIIDLAHGLHLSVVAEGVEEAAARDWLLDAGCDRVQGFLIARPLPASEFRALLREQAIRPPSADFHHRASPNR